MSPSEEHTEHTEEPSLISDESIHHFQQKPQSPPIEYAAFISYRHLPHDADIAREVQHAIETYRLPRQITRSVDGLTSSTDKPANSTDGLTSSTDKTTSPTDKPTSHNKTNQESKLGKCFRDEDELAASSSLPKNIEQALATSRTLIVICSPKTKDSTWVQREIETFERLHGRERIICVLAAGSSAESIPPLLRWQKVKDVDGVMREIPAEPLAADLRSNAPSKRKNELLRIIATVAGCNFDDLKQRERTRWYKRIGIGVTCAIALIALIGALAYHALTSTQEALIAESKNLAITSEEQLAHGNRIKAIETALKALPSSSSDTSRPLVPEAQKALERALLVEKDPTSPWTPFFNVQTQNPIEQFITFDSSPFIATLDSEGNIDLFSSRDGAHYQTLSLPSYLDDPEHFSVENWIITPARNGRTGSIIAWSYADNDPLLCIDPYIGELNWKIDKHGVNSCTLSEDKSLCAIARFTEGLFICEQIDAETGEIIQSVDKELPGTTPITGRFMSCLSSDNQCFYLALNERILQVVYDSSNHKLAGLSRQCLSNVSSLAYHDNALFTASYEFEGQEGITGFSSPWQVNAYFTNQDSWSATGTCNMNVIAPNQAWTAFLGVPCIVGFLTGENPIAVCSAGRTMFLLDCKTGTTLFTKDFNSAIVGMRVHYADEVPLLFIATADGALDVQLPGNVQNLRGFISRTVSEFYFKEVTFYEQDSIILALAQPVELDNQLIAFCPTPKRAEDAPELSLDELIEQGTDTIRRYKDYEFDGVLHPL